MKPKLTFKLFAKRFAIFALATMALPSTSALAGNGWGDNTAADGTAMRQQTYYANSPSGVHVNCAPEAAGQCDSGKAIRKFKDPLPGLAAPGGPNGNGTGKYIPSAVATKWVNQQGVQTNDDYYEIAVVEWKEQFHSDLKAGGSTVRGYVQIDPIATASSGAIKSGSSLGVALSNIDGTPIMMPDGIHQAYAYDAPHYLGPVITANRGVPTRIKFDNLLPVGRGEKDLAGNPLPGGKRNGDLFLPVDEMLPGAGFGPDGKVKFTQNRVEIHLHGGDNPWISDGTPHQWIAPAGEADANNPLSVAAEAVGKALSPAEAAVYLRGASAVNVPDMPDPGPGSMTYYFPNGESARLMFYHDHAFGLTRLNVYAGVASGYVLQDTNEQAAIQAGSLPADQIPLVFQEKTFVPKDIAIQDAKWDETYWGQEGDLWFPHVYETNQDPTSIDGTKPVGRWDWGPYFWPVFPSYYDRLPNGEHVLAQQTSNGAPVDTGLTEVTTTPEAFMDTPVVNGQAYPTMTVEPKAYRFRMLNAMNDRYINLGLYVAADATTTNPNDPLNPATQPTLCDGNQTRADGTKPALADCTEVKMVHFDTSYPNAYYPTLPAAPFGNPNAEFKFPDGTNPLTAGLQGTGWGNPSGFLAIGSGVPDPATAGPDIHLIGNEGGFLANEVSIPSTIMNYEANKRSVTLLNVLEKGLFINPAGRADAVIDFSQYAGKTLILYNDSPAPLPAGDPRIDYYTGMGDYSSVGGAENVLPGYGPNDRTMIQIYVKGPSDGVTPAAPLDVAALASTVPALHGATQPLPVVPEPRYNAAFGATNPVIASTTKETLARIYTGAIYLGKYNALTFTTPEAITYTKAPVCNNQAACLVAMQAPNIKETVPAGSVVNAYVQNKAIQELFDPTYGRMNATLGVELPFTSSLTQTTIPLGYVDPTTEKITDGETQFWKITHNGVDSHPVHFHLVNVQVINRVGWDGTLKSPTADEIGWKETVIMNPLEDIVVAVRAKAPKLPFGLPNSVRARDPSQPVGPNVIEGFTQIDPVTGNPAVVSNKVEDFGWEYVWHCHILGHEENDFMRPFVFDYWNGKDAKDLNNFAVNRPDATTLSINGNVLSWIDPTPGQDPLTLANPKNEIGFKLTRTSNDGLPPVTFNVIANATSYVDNFNAVVGATYTYTIAAYNQMGIADASNAVVKSDALVPATDLLVGVVTDTTVGLSWSNGNITPTTATLITVTNPSGVVVQTITPVTSPTVVTGLASDTSYTFSVVLTNAGGVTTAPVTATAKTKVAAASGLVVSAVTDTTASIAWTNPASGGNAVVTVSPAAGVVVTPNGTGNGASFTGMTPNTTYTFSVVVTGVNGGTSPAATATATTNAAAATGLTVSGVTATTANVSWTSASGNAVLTVSPAATVVQNGNTATVTGMTPNTAYNFSVVVTGSNGVASAAVVANATTNAAAATGLTVSGVTATTANVAWTSASGNAVLTVSPAATVLQTGNTAVVSGMTPNTAYTFSVVVTGSNNVPSAATVANATTNALPATGLTVTGVTDVAANVSWTSPVGGGNALMTAKPTAGVGAVVTSTAPGVVTGLTPYTDYTFTVVITGSNGVPSAAITATAHTLATLNAANIGTARLLSANTLSLSWTDNSVGETSYRVEVRRNNGAWTAIPAAQVTGTLSAPGTGALLTATVTTTMNQALYQFRVVPLAAATNQTGPASASADIDLRVAPNAVTLSSTVNTGNVALTWTATSNNTQTIRIQRRQSIFRFFSAWVTISVQPATSTSYIDTSVVPSTTYQYRVQTTNIAGTRTSNQVNAVAR